MSSSEGVCVGSGSDAELLRFSWAIAAKRRSGLGSKLLETWRTVEDGVGVFGRGEDGVCWDGILRQGEGILVRCETA